MALERETVLSLDLATEDEFYDAQQQFYQSVGFDPMGSTDEILLDGYAAGKVIDVAKLSNGNEFQFCKQI